MSPLWPNLMQDHIPAASPMACLYPIEDQAILSVSGPDSAKFMQGQFTCNLQHITESQYRRGACCNAKGRMMANFTLAQWTGDYLLSTHESVAESLMAHLKKYMVFFKSQMNSSPWIAAGLHGENAATLLNQAFGSAPSEDNGVAAFDWGLVLKLPFEGGYELWLKPESAQATLQMLLPHCSVSTSEAWAAHRMALGLGLVTADTIEHFIPQMLNLGFTDGISFNKGCYTGQEIVARMQYLGKLKKHMHLVKASAPLTLDMAIHSPNKAGSIGELVNLGVNPQGEIIALAIIESQYLEDTLTAQSDDSQPVSIELLSLPYDPLKTGE